MKSAFTTGMIALCAAGLAMPALAQDGDEAERAERRTSGGHSKEAFIESYDADGDGVVTMAEFNAERAKIHEGYDMDGDGRVSQVEYVDDYQYRLDAELAEIRANRLRQAHFRFGVLDADHDGTLTLEELNESGTRTFSRLDSNEDGIIDEADTADAF
ncbi:EF-hand domain-containing protein [Aurantiacibacter flavus]|uniref:EF-hand domain-containing protein n=1 Tax=Aurantiacibacter flavus TaxID=3145232 RepID=A0ABV0CYA8_9SPHN